MNRFMFIPGLIILVFFASLCEAGIPKLINYQGMLTQSDGTTPVPNGNYNLTFKIYGSLSGTDSLWREYHSNVSVTNGLFNVILGSVTTLNLAFNTDYWLGIRVGNDPELSPRIRLTSVGYAYRASVADSAAASPPPSTGGGWTDAGTKVYLTTSTDTVGIGTDIPHRKLHITEDVNGLSYPLKLDNPNSTLGTGTGILFSAGGSGSARGKGSLVYEVTSTWNRGKFHFLQDAGLNADNPNLSDAVMTIQNDGMVGIGTTTPGVKLDVASGSGTAIRAVVTSGGGWGIETSATEGGAHIGDADGTSHAYIGHGNTAVEGYGNEQGGYFKNAIGNGEAWLGYRVDATDFGVLGKGGVGVQGQSATTASWGRLGWSTYKVYGNGSVDFVQNHPYNKGQVITYAAPEGDEVATYTRGHARLVNGEVQVMLGETFKWVTNPDIGLTAHITPRGECEGLFVASLTTSEMVVKELRGGTSNAEFDYLVYGLRIGFEEASVVQEKAPEAYIPSMKDHRDLYNKYPELRHFNALERFREMNAQIGKPFDLGASRALRDAIHEFDPAIDKLPEPTKP